MLTCRPATDDKLDSFTVVGQFSMRYPVCVNYGFKSRPVPSGLRVNHPNTQSSIPQR
jgi:hypothetical protein